MNLKINIICVLYRRIVYVCVLQTYLSLLDRLISSAIIFLAGYIPAVHSKLLLGVDLLIYCYVSQLDRLIVSYAFIIYFSLLLSDMFLDDLSNDICRYMQCKHAYCFNYNCVIIIIQLLTSGY